MTGYYSLGLVGYEITIKSDDVAQVLFVGTDREQVPRDYKIQVAPSGRTFVRPHGHRVYLDECIRL
jgi:hypothetical protein